VLCPACLALAVCPICFTLYAGIDVPLADANGAGPDGTDESLSTPDPPDDG